MKKAQTVLGYFGLLLLLFEREREREQSGEGQKEREENLKLAPHRRKQGLAPTFLRI